MRRRDHDDASRILSQQRSAVSFTNTLQSQSLRSVPQPMIISAQQAVSWRRGNTRNPDGEKSQKATLYVTSHGLDSSVRSLGATAPTRCHGGNQSRTATHAPSKTEIKRSLATSIRGKEANVLLACRNDIRKSLYE